MAADDRLIEIMAELLTEVHQMRLDSNERMDRMDGRLEGLDNRLERLEDQQIKTNLALGELRLSVIRLGDKVEQIADLDKRMRIIENIVLRPAA
ncbi:MAG: hypothetical protein H7330_14580 [Hymenobacteraceae bacterium]|nr:hypothetical protein [Hymenobacteraceae bacterium]